MADDPAPIVIRFACGAEYRATEMPEFSRIDKRGRGKLLVYDSEGCNPPTFPTPESPNVAAPCRYQCPCKKKAGRQLVRAMRSDDKFYPPRWIVTCYADVLAAITPYREDP